MNDAMSQMPMGNTDKGGKGAMVGAVIVVLVLIVGGIYFFSSRQGTEVMESLATPEEEAAVIQSDLDSVDLSGVDADIQSMDKELIDLK